MKHKLGLSRMRSFISDFVISCSLSLYITLSQEIFVTEKEISYALVNLSSDKYVNTSFNPCTYEKIKL